MGWQTCSIKGQIVNVLEFADLVSLLQLLNSVTVNMKAATDNR